MRTGRRTRLLLAAALLGALPVQAAVDAVAVGLTDPRAALRWENVLGAPYWVGGSPPVRDAARGWHAVDLDAAEGVALHLPPYALLRVVAAADSDARAPVFAVSQGTGLAIEREVAVGTDGRSWLLRTDSAQPSVVHLRSAGDGPPQRVALFLARYELPPAPLAYRHDLPLPGAAVALRRADEVVARPHVRVDARQELILSARGPDRLLLEYRLATPEAPRTGLPVLEAMVAGSIARLVRQPTGPETVAPVQIDGRWQASGRLERLTLDLPPGEHQVRLRATHAILLRAAAARWPDLLLPGLNLPEGWDIRTGPAELEAAEQEAIAASASNRWRDISLLAAERLRSETRALPAQGSLQAAADELHAQFTEFHDLLPVASVPTRLLAAAMRQPQPVVEPPRHRIVGPRQADVPEPLPRAMFHHIRGAGTRFILPEVAYPLRLRALVPQGAPPARIEVRYDDGRPAVLHVGMQALPDEWLRPAASDQALVPVDDWPPGLGGQADRHGGAAPARRVAAVDWLVPTGARNVELRALDADAEVALQWSGSTEYFLDDELLASLLADDGLPGAFEPVRQDVLRPLQRRVDAARAQYVANIAPPLARAPGDAAAARRAAQAAAREAEPARAVELWVQALAARDDALRAGALQGLARALFAAGERFAGERLLRSHWIGDDPVLARAAQAELEALYQREGDTETQLLFAAAQAAGDSTAFGALGTLLAATGEDRAALLAALAAPRKARPALDQLLTSALRLRLWATFDALLAQLEPAAARAFWRAQRTLAQEPLQATLNLFEDPVHAPWQRALHDAGEIARALHGDTAGHARAVQAWTDWQDRHPGPRRWTADAAAVAGHGGGISLRSVSLNLRSRWWRASLAQPLLAQVVGPARVRVEARPLHADTSSIMTGWLQVEAEGQRWLMPFQQNQPSAGLVMERASALAGAVVIRDIDLPAGLHVLRVHAGAAAAAARILVEQPALQLPLLPAPAPAHFTAQAVDVAAMRPAPGCGGRQGCLLLADGDLQALELPVRTIHWPGLPPPRGAAAPLAAKLAQGDLDGALALAADPREKMRLLLWQAQTQPAARSRALALGAALSAEHPLPEIRSQWELLSQGSGWTTLPLVDRSAGIRRVQTAPGAPVSPAGRIRAALLAPLRAGELRLGPESRATLAYDEARPLTVDAEITLDELPGLPTLPVQVMVTLGDQLLHAVRLETGRPREHLRIQVPRGEQTLSVALHRPYQNQFVRLRFSGAVLPQQQVTRDWHIATHSQPVQVTVAGPSWVRIDRLEADGIRSEERLLADRTTTFSLAPRPGAAESLYRISHRLPDPLPADSAPPPRPDRYQPEPMAQAPPAWSTLAPLAPPRQVRFLDAEPLARPTGTWSLRAGRYARRDTEEAGDDVPRFERFIEAGLTWRQGNDDQNRWGLADLLVRRPEGAPPVLGLRVATEQHLPWLASFPHPFRVDGSLSAFVQDTPEGLGVAATARAAVSQVRDITPTLSHEPRAALVLRAMSLRRVAYLYLVDSDVFSRYRVDHLRALSLGDTLSWRPWRDTHLAAQATLTTNTNLDPLKPDHISLDLRWRQLAGPMILEAGVRSTSYLADRDRARRVVHRQWRLLAGTGWWLGDGTRLELLTQMRFDPGRPDFVGGVELRWHWDGARGLRDFSPSEVDFRSLRTWRAPIIGNTFEDQ